MLRLAVFDLDGTLLNSLPDLADAVNYALEKVQLPQRTDAEVRSFIGHGILDLLQKSASPVTDEEVLAKLKMHFDAYYGVNYCNRSVLYPGIRELLQLLKEKGIQGVIYSNKSDEFVQQIASALFSEDTFTGIMGYRKEFPKKPDPAQLKAFQKTLDIPDEDCIYIGDSDVDIITGKNAHMTTIGVSWGYRDRALLEQTKPDYLVDSVSQLQQLIVKLSEA